MKRKILALLMSLAVAGSTLAQLGKKKEEAADTSQKKEAVSDTTKAPVTPSGVATDTLKKSMPNDSVSTQLVLYKDFYAYISNKFFPEKSKKIKVEKAIALADSLSAANNSKWKGIETLSKSKIDSLSLLLKKADTLQMENQTFKALLISLIGENVYPLNEHELKGRWEVFVQPLKVMGSGQESAIVSLDKMVLSDSLYKASIKQIVFLEEDLADIHFFGGKKTKCFYKVADFSRDKTYSIFLQKGDEINIKLFVTPVPRGLQISYKVGRAPGLYMFGYMRK